MTLPDTDTTLISKIDNYVFDTIALSVEAIPYIIVYTYLNAFICDISMRQICYTHSTCYRRVYFLRKSVDVRGAADSGSGRIIRRICHFTGIGNLVRFYLESSRIYPIFMFVYGYSFLTVPQKNFHNMMLKEGSSFGLHIIACEYDCRVKYEIGY